MEVFRSAFITKCSELSTEPSAIVLNQLKYEISNAKKGGNQVNEKLDLSGHPLHIKTITALCTALQTDVIFTNLIFSDAFLGDGGAIIIAGALKTNTTVKMLDLRGNNIRSDGATALAQMMKVNTTLETLLLEWNCIGIWEVGAKALGDALPINQYLQHLDLRNCKIGPQSAICLSQGLRHNTNLRILGKVFSSINYVNTFNCCCFFSDLRWNNVGIIGGRAFVEALKWNMVITEIELTGNEIPDDVLRSIGIALDRNRDRFKHLLQNKVHSEHLSSTLQALTTAHHSNLEQLSTKLSASDGRAQTLSEKLSQTSRELSEMLEYRKNAAARLRELEVELSHERKESSKQLSDLQTELLKEKDRRLKLEDKLTISSSSMNGRMIELEANLRETEMKAEVLRRDKTMLLEEMDKAKEREKSIYELHKEKMARMEANHTNRLNALTEAKDAEIKELTKRLEEKFKNVQTEKQRLEEEIDALKTKAINEKRQLIDKFSETETRIKKEEVSITIRICVLEAHIIYRMPAVKNSRPKSTPSVNHSTNYKPTSLPSPHPRTLSSATTNSK
ncbi:hypothetical protein BC829DRAFT_107797 [Chytridium lagenaria]|nr:hypothetical protein BC829DRAFT_107797 [Chytridium lagenaria]